MTARPASLLTAVAILTLLAPAASGQDDRRGGGPLPTLPGDGSELFRGLFAFHDIRPVPADGIDDHGHLIVVLLGLPRENDRWARVVSQTLRDGGSVLIAGEGRATLDGYFPSKATQIAFTGERVQCEVPSNCLGGRPDCPFVVPKEPSAVDAIFWKSGIGSPGFEWALFSPWKQTATNRPGAIRVQGYGPYAKYILAGFPAGSVVEGGGRLPANSHFAVGASGTGDQPPFRSLIMADPSVFSNQMIAGTEANPTDNLLFANALVTWLSADGKRNRCLFVEAGRVQEEFDAVRYAEISPPLPPLPVPPLPSPFDPELQRRLTEGVNRAVANFEDRDVLNQALTGGPDNDRQFRNATRTLATVAAVLAVLWLLRRVWKGRHEPDMPPVPKDTGRVAASGPQGSLARRREEILQAGNYTEPVREYLRELFAARGLHLPPGADPPRKPPPVEATGRDAGAIRGHVRILWDVAFAATPRPVTYSRWKELEPMIDAVRRAADEGRWRFAPGGTA